MPRLLTLAIAAALLAPAGARAEHAGHTMPMNTPMPAEMQATKPESAAKQTAKKPPKKPTTKPAVSKPTMSNADHSKMEGMDPSQMQGMDHSKMDHTQMQGMDHSTMDHAQMDHPGTSMDPDTPVTPIPPITEADLAAAFPAVHAHHQHGSTPYSYWLMDRLEVSDADPGTSLGWDTSAWIGGDVQRLWLRSEGTAVDGTVEHGDVEVLYGRGVRAWWDVVAGLRQDVGTGPSRTWAAFGMQGLAPYKFEVRATAYIGQGGRTALRLGADYDTLFTNRLILQWRTEANAYGRSDPAAGIGSGLSTLEAGVRLRYEITRQFAPYVGIEHERAFGNTAAILRSTGHGAGETRVVAGLRLWF